MTGRPAIILLSGGLDSATVLARARAQGHRCLALTFDYGQRHRHELAAAAAIARTLGAIEQRTILLDPRAFAGSALTTTAPSAAFTPAPDQPPIPKGRAESAMAEDIPATYVPARNLVFLAIAIATAESVGASDIYIGVNAVDYSGYPDCRPEFIAAMQHAARLGTKAGVKAAAANAPATPTIHAPLLDMTKAQIIRLGTSLGVDYALTASCYDPCGSPDQPLACGQCDACTLRRSGFHAAEVPDPTRYATAGDAP